MSRRVARDRPVRPFGPSAVPRTYRVDVPRTAERDLATIHAFSARDNPAAAAAWLDTIERNIVNLGRWPRRCPVIPEAPEFAVEYRHLVDGPYRTIFHVAG